VNVSLIRGTGEEKPRIVPCVTKYCVALGCGHEEEKVNGSSVTSVRCWTWANTGQILGARIFKGKILR